MAITLAKFKWLPLADQLGVVLHEGTYVATRYQDEDSINLYHLGNFLVEVYYDSEINHLHRCTCRAATGKLDDYALYVELTDL